MFRLSRALVTTGLVVTSSLVAFTGSAGAGIPAPDGPLTIVKTVSGPVPTGTTFTVSVVCDAPVIDDGGNGTDTATVTFDATGQPTSPDVITFLDNGASCTVTETAKGGAATTTYECEGELPAAAGVQQVAPDVCDAAGPQSTPITVNIVTLFQNATVTVNNTFVAPVVPLTPLTPAPQVVAQPAFTG